MSSQSEYIPLTIRVKNDLYQKFHALVVERGATHTGIIRILIQQFISEQKKATKS